MSPSTRVRALLICSILVIFLIQPVPAPSPLRAAVIVVGDDCALADAITAANSNESVGGCAAGTAGRDIIVLTGDVILNAVDNSGPHGPNGLPVVTGDVIIRGGGHTIARSADAGVPPFRLFEIAPQGRLRLDHATLRNGLIEGNAGRRGANATTPGTDGDDGEFFLVVVVYLGEGNPGEDGGKGDRGAEGEAGGTAQGGAIFNQGELDLAFSVLESSRVAGGPGGRGGNGSVGGTGGEGGWLGKIAPILVPAIGGTGGRGGDGGDGGEGGAGGMAQGGALYNDGGRVSIAASTLSENVAIGGRGGPGGNGATAGSGGDGGSDGTDIASGGDGGLGGGGGRGGTGGAAQGGAIYNASGTVNVWLSTFEANRTQGGRAGNGGQGAQGGTGGTQTGDGGLGGPGGFGGIGGVAQGGALYSVSGSLTVDRSSLAAQQAVGGLGGAGNQAGTGGDGGDPFLSVGVGGEAFEAATTQILLALFGVAGYDTGGPGGFGGFGGNGGSGQGGAIFNQAGEVRVLSSTLNANQAQASAGGEGGAGSLGGYGSDFFAALYEWLREQGVSDFRGLRPGESGSNAPPGDTGDSQGGAIAHNAGNQTIDSSTLVENQAALGGALWQRAGMITIVSSTIARNRATEGGGVFVRPSIETSVLELGNTILASNSGNSPDLSGTVLSLNYNLIGSLRGGILTGVARFDLINIPPALAALEANGGPTLTVALQPQSPAINRGRCLSTFDQRGYYRIDGLCDIGAFERGATAALPRSDESPPEPSANEGMRLRLPPNSFSRVIAADHVFLENPGEIGVDAVVNRDVIAAVDIFTFGGGSAAGGEVCLRGAGHMIFLGAGASPRTPTPLAATEHDSYTCAVLPGDGTVVLVENLP
jgi:hypothetical protein